MCVRIADDHRSLQQPPTHDTLSYSSFAMGECVRWSVGGTRLGCACGPASTDCWKPSNTPGVQSSCRRGLRTPRVSWPPGIRVLLPLDTGPTAAPRPTKPGRPPDHVPHVSCAISNRHSHHGIGVGAAGGSAAHAVLTRRGGKRVHYPCSGSLPTSAKLQSTPCSSRTRSGGVGVGRMVYVPNRKKFYSIEVPNTETAASGPVRR